MVLEVKGFRCLKKMKGNLFIGLKGCLGVSILLAGFSTVYANPTATIVNETRCQVKGAWHYYPPFTIISNHVSQSVPVYYYEGKLDSNPKDLSLAGTIPAHEIADNIPFVDDTYVTTGGKDGETIVVSLTPPSDGVHPNSVSELSFFTPCGVLPSGNYTYYYAQGKGESPGSKVALEIENEDQIHQCSPDQP